MSLTDQIRNLKVGAGLMGASEVSLRNRALEALSALLEERKEAVFEANKRDLAAAKAADISQPVQKRMVFNEEKLKACRNGIQDLVSMPDPIGEVSLNRALDEGLVLKRVSCPIGVIGVIFEARPDAMVQIGALCIKSANCGILKGGKETAETNRALFEILKEACVRAELPECLALAQSHEDVDEILKLDKDVDLLIPRGSNAFVRYIMDHTRIPVMGHADGICHAYVHKDADLAKAIPILLDAKTQYPAACNAVEMVLVDQEIAEGALPVIQEAFQAAGVIVHGPWDLTGKTDAKSENAELEKEYLGMEVGLAAVGGLAEAIRHINTHGSHHTDTILTESKEAAAKFTEMVDSAGVYVNCSTRFADGYRYGFGAEVGISTGKLHARGPVGLEGLTSYKYVLIGEGQVAAPYVTGEKHFHFRDL
ncbi:MAG: glutamate-5-semialdehyde dehydrogenase [Lachnospiraceae bacterium]|nr:glutamate-5-semialdehyde dehydrogenase [Lachnospiraceae bacterium]